MNRCWCKNTELEEYSGEYFKCTKCGSLVSKKDFSQSITDVKDEENDLYGAQYWEKGMLEKAGVSSMDELHERYLTGRVPYWVQKIIEYLPMDGEIVEVGCGLGELSYILDKAGYHITAYELSNEVCEYIQQKFDIRIICGEFKQQQKGLSAVIAMDVFEHLLDPIDFLRSCRACLKDDGILCMQTPCYNPQLSFEQVEKANMNFKKLLVPDEHIYLYSRDSIAKVLEENGFVYHEFVPAFFGDDYDMFLFASAHEIKKNSIENINDFLSKTSNETLIKVWLSLFEQNKRVNKLNEQVTKNSEQQLRDIEKLTAIVREKEEYIGNLEQNNNQQIKDIQTLTELIKEKNDYINNLEKNNNQQIENQQSLNVQIKQKDAQISILQQGCDERMSAIESLNEKLRCADEKWQKEITRNEQAEQLLATEIQTRDEKIKALENACEERLKDVMTLNEMIDNMNMQYNKKRRR